MEYVQNEQGEITFEPTPGSRLSKEEAQRYGPALQSLCVLKQGLSAEDLVEEANRPDSIFRDWFTWDNRIAAHQYRLEQARVLMRSIQVRIIVPAQTDPVPIRVMHCVHRIDGKKYDFLNTIVQVPEELDEVLQRALQQLIGWRDRYAALQKCAPMIKQIDLFVAETQQELALQSKIAEIPPAIPQPEEKIAISEPQVKQTKKRSRLLPAGSHAQKPEVVI